MQVIYEQYLLFIASIIILHCKYYSNQTIQKESLSFYNLFIYYKYTIEARISIIIGALVILVI